MKKIFSIFAAALFCANLFAANVYFVNSDGWAAVKAYMWKGEGEAKNADWPGADMSKTGEQARGFDVYEYAVPEGFVNIIFNNGSGTQSSNLLFDAEKPYHFDGMWFASLAEVEAYVAPKFFVTGDSALVVDAGGEGKGWNPSALKSEKDTLVLNLKAGQAYNLKVTLKGRWQDGEIFGYNELSDKTGVSEGDDHNIHFELKTAGEVKVIYFVKDEEVTFKLLGDFVIIEDGYYLLGTINKWKPSADFLMVKNGELEEYILEVTLAVDDEIKVVRCAANKVAQWYPAEGANYIVDAAHAGLKTVYFRPAGNDDWKEFYHDGFIWIEANDATAIDNSQESKVESQKTIVNGQLLIMMNGNAYNAQGMLVK